MTMARQIVGVCGLAVVLLATGCGPNPKDLQIQALQEKNGQLEQDNANLRDRLALAIRERDAARNRAYALEQQVADLRKMIDERPKQAGAPGWTPAGEWSWIELGSDFLFDSGRATLKPAAEGSLQKVVGDIQQYYPDKMIWVVGHTDSDPILKTKGVWKDNLDLSANRAMTVYRELQKLGLDPQRMIAGGQGEYAPRASNATKEGKAENRRVQIVAVPQPGEVGSATPGEPSAAPSEAPTPTRRTIEK